MLYTYALYVVGAPFGALFLLHVGLVVLSAYTTIAVVAGLDLDVVRRQLAEAPARAVGGALVGVGLLATVGLMVPVLTALADPAPVDPLLHARWIVDFAVGNPVLLIGGVLLWRRVGLGYATAAGLLFLSGVNGVAFAVGAALGALLTAAPIDAAVSAVTYSSPPCASHSCGSSCAAQGRVRKPVRSTRHRPADRPWRAMGAEPAAARRARGQPADIRGSTAGSGRRVGTGAARAPVTAR